MISRYLDYSGCILLCVFAALSLFAFSVIGFADEGMESGKHIAKSLCSRCHAIEELDESRHEKAPAFRTLSQRYPLESLEEALAEGIYTGHPDMPAFELAPDDIEDLLNYLQSIQKS